MLVEARSLIDSFHSMIRKRIVYDLEPWTLSASKSLVASFSSGILRDPAAVRAAITEPWSTGKPKARSRSTSWRNGRTTTIENSTFCRLG